MHQDDELDFGEDDLVLQPAPAHLASSLDQVDPDSAASTSTAHQGSAAPPSTTMTSLNATAPGATTTTAAGPAHAATVSAHQLAPASAAQTAASTPPVQPKKPHDESLDALGNKLPQGWVSRVSKSTGNVYYRNTVLNTSAWDIPTEPAVPAQPEPVVAHVAPVVAAPAEQAPVAAVPAPAAPVLAPEQAPALVALEPVPQQQPQQETQMQDVRSHDASAPSAPVAPKPRVFVHPDRLKFADPEAAASSTSSFAPPTGPRGGSSMYPARRTSTAAQERHALPPQDQIVAPTAPARRRGGRSGRRSVGGDGFAANQIPVGTPRGPRVGGAAEQGTPGASAGLDDRWAASPAPAAASAVDASEPRFAVPSGPRAGRDRPPHIAAAAASTPSLNRYPSSSASATLASPVAEPGSALSPPTTRRTLYSPATDRDASLDPHASARLPAPSESASPGPERGNGRQQSLGAVSASSGLSQAEKLEQQRLARLAATGGPPPSLSALDVAPSVSSDRFAPSFGSVDAAGGSADRFAPRGGRRGRGGRGGDGAAAPAAVLVGANSMPVGAAGGGWGDRARIAREKLEREEREAKERDEARDAARREQIKRDAEDDERRRMRAEEADVVLGRERERKRLEDEAEAREKERRASAYGARGAGGRGAPRRSRSPERETSSRRRSMSPAPRRRSPSPPPRHRSPSPPARRRDYSPPPSMSRGRDYSPPPATGRGHSPSPPLMRMRSRSPPPHLRRRGGGGGQRSPSPGRLPPLRFPMGNILDKSSSALRGRFRDPEADAAGPDSSLIRSAGPMMPLGDGRRAPFDDVDSPKKRRARGGKSRRGRASEGMYLDEADRGGARRERSLSPRRGEREDDLRGGGSRWNGDGRGGSLASPIPRPGPSLLSRLGGTGSSLPDKPGPSSSSSAGKRVRDPEEVIREEEKRKRL
ncbi:uncharacterized protein RHOBADRAFT_51498 [Rhodotorula graminis WP1]|uniref:WW domain-containing protein n=1 Tax=Rhodotorula graminis (strain WP1) TaxID=578459 RepID=A0A194SB42_RHOGW|nr:uncharacterized protein RHOBADRAFT_51498 [Rhodotorula graminis WP1]KPV77675.1 hypothetical protein RHOBADRAFT_51498 [Rhodotorula graminis WP1]